MTEPAPPGGLLERLRPALREAFFALGLYFFSLAAAFWLFFPVQKVLPWDRTYPWGWSNSGLSWVTGGAFLLLVLLSGKGLLPLGRSAGFWSRPRALFLAACVYGLGLSLLASWAQAHSWAQGRLGLRWGLFLSLFGGLLGCMALIAVEPGRRPIGAIASALGIAALVHALDQVIPVWSAEARLSAERSLGLPAAALGGQRRDLEPAPRPQGGLSVAKLCNHCATKEALVN